MPAPCIYDGPLLLLCARYRTSRPSKINPPPEKKCPGIDAIVQYKPGAGGGLMWSQMDAFMKARTKAYMETAKRLGLIK